MNSYRLTGIRILQGCGKIICKILKKYNILLHINAIFHRSF